ncbi:MAG: hypothetical protein OXR66_06390 [Candidatus Woesearchaeota archaeon]|nr:hypothetical protein [Candidatus Woesearchaeota archaeon]
MIVDISETGMLPENFELQEGTVIQGIYGSVERRGSWLRVQPNEDLDNDPVAFDGAFEVLMGEHENYFHQARKEQDVDAFVQDVEGSLAREHGGTPRLLALVDPLFHQIITLGMIIGNHDYAPQRELPTIDSRMNYKQCGLPRFHPVYVEPWDGKYACGDLERFGYGTHVCPTHLTQPQDDDIAITREDFEKLDFMIARSTEPHLIAPTPS